MLGITSLGALLSSLNSGTLVIALPDILRDLHTDLFALLWIVVGYTLVATVLVLNAGRLADMVGRAKMFTVGLGVFTLASVFCGLAPTATLLIAGRIVQGVGGALIMATSAALVTDAFPRRELGRALGINAMVVGAGLMLGPILGGFLTGSAGGRCSGSTSPSASSASSSASSSCASSRPRRAGARSTSPAPPSTSSACSAS